MANWPLYLSHDYSGAVVRLAAILEKGKLHLVFACVEFYPSEVPLPPVVGVERRNLGDARFYFGVYGMSCSEALEWYENAARGHVIVPDTKQVINASPLGPEPSLGRLVSSDDAPFVASWHGGPRISRLVSLTDLDKTISEFIAREKAEPRQKVAREWLAERLHFDVLAREDWLGGVVLIVPNPVARSFSMTLFPDPATGGETIRATVRGRLGVSMSSLSISFRELRFNALSTVETIRVDRFGRAELFLPETTREIAVELNCDQRGLLSAVRPVGFIRSIHVNIEATEGAIDVEVPAVRSGGQSTVYRRNTRSTSTQTVGSIALPPTTSRLLALNQRQARRTGEARPDSLWRATPLDEVIFFGDRPAAGEFIRSLVAGARSSVTFVDPFFDHISLREFAIATSYADVSIRVLLGRDHLKNVVPVSADEATFAGNIMFAELAQLKERSRDYRLIAPELRLMGGDCRKYHDRFLIVDSDVWHCGHSFNQVGRTEVSMMTRLRHPETIKSEINLDIESAEGFEIVWTRQAAGLLMPEPVKQSYWTCIVARWQGLVKSLFLRRNGGSARERE